MLMPSQSPSSTATIQTLPSDQQQQQQQQQKKQQDEYVDTLNSQKNNTTKRFRREKSMEFDDDTRFQRSYQLMISIITIRHYESTDRKVRIHHLHPVMIHQPSSSIAEESTHPIPLTSNSHEKDRSILE